MTAAIIQEKSEVKVKNLYLKNPVVLKTLDPYTGVDMTCTVEEEHAKAWCTISNSKFKTLRYKTWFDDYKSQNLRCVICKR